MTNDEIRERIAERGITTENVNRPMLIDLHIRLSRALEASGLMNGTFAMDPIKDPMFLTCRSHYFKNREAVSFNRDGFIGMAGWSSSRNITPIREAVLEWAGANERLFTQNHLELLQHTLGADSRYKKKEWGFRNYFCASSGHTDLNAMRELEQLGFVRSSEREGYINFYATKAGALAVGFKPYQLRKTDLAA